MTRRRLRRGPSIGVNWKMDGGKRPPFATRVIQKSNATVGKVNCGLYYLPNWLARRCHVNGAKIVRENHFSSLGLKKHQSFEAFRDPLCSEDQFKRFPFTVFSCAHQRHFAVFCAEKNYSVKSVILTCNPCVHLAIRGGGDVAERSKALPC